MQFLGNDSSKYLVESQLERVEKWLDTNLTKIEKSSILADLKNQEEVQRKKRII